MHILWKLVIHCYLCIYQNISWTTIDNPFLSHAREHNTKKIRGLLFYLLVGALLQVRSWLLSFQKAQRTKMSLPVAFLAGLAAGVSAAVPCLGHLLCGLCLVLALAVPPHSGRHQAANGGCHFLLSELLPVILRLNNQYKGVKTIYPDSVVVHLSTMKTWCFKLTCIKSFSMRNFRSELAMVARDGHKSTKTRFCKWTQNSNTQKSSLCFKFFTSNITKIFLGNISYFYLKCCK